MTSPNDPTSPDDPAPSIPQQPTQAIPEHYAYPHEDWAAEQAPAPGETVAEGVAFSDVDGPSADGLTTSGRRTGLIAGGLVALLVVGGGIAFGVAKLSGGGAQPADVIPADAVAYARIDVDPSAGQKIAAVRFLNKIPGAKDVLGADDPRPQLWEQVVKSSDNTCLAKFDFAKDIAPWLGERAGFGLRPGKTGDEPNMLVVLQTSDEAKAGDTMTRLMACNADSTGKSDVRTRDGYVLLTPKGQGDATLTALDKGSLSSNATFAGDMSALGDQGIASMWFDAAKFVKAMGALDPSMAAGAGLPDTGSMQGRAAFTVRFDPSYVEVAGISRGATGVKKISGDGAQLASLPGDTVAALQISGGDELLDGAWPELQKGLGSIPGVGSDVDLQAMIEDQLGVKLPDDLKVLLGRSFTLALPDQELGSDIPAVGLKVAGTDAKRAAEVLTSIEDVSGGAIVLDKKVDGDRLYAATTPDYAAALARSGKLGDSEAFKTALGDTSRMTAGFYVDLDRIEKYYLPEVDPKAHDAVEALRAVGVNIAATGDGEGSYSLRVVGN